MPEENEAGACLRASRTRSCRPSARPASRARRPSGALAVLSALPLALLACNADPPTPHSVRGDMNIVLSSSSYWGDGPGNSRAVAMDETGNFYVVGGGFSSSWPHTLETLGSGGASDVAVAKFSPEGRPLWSLLLGGPEEDYAYVATASPAGELYIGGRAGPGFPTTPGAFDRSFNGGRARGPHGPTDGFALKLSPEGRLLYATYIGGSENENTRAIHLLPSGKLIVGGGNTRSPDLPTDAGLLPGPVLKPHLGGRKDSWVGVLAADAASLDFLTYFGPSDDGSRGDETIRALGVDSIGNIWIGGTTHGGDLAPTPDAFQKARGDAPPSGSAYIAKLGRDGRRLVYFSWLGGQGNDEIETKGVSDEMGRFYVAGSTASPDFPVTPGAFQKTLLGGGGGAHDGDGFVAQIHEDGSLGFATLFGGSAPGPESFFGPAVDAAGNIFLTGRFRSPDAPTTLGAAQPFKSGASGVLDAMLVVFGPRGRLRYSTFFGGTGSEIGRHLAVDRDGLRVVLVGETDSLDLPLLEPAQRKPAGTFLATFRVSE